MKKIIRSICYFTKNPNQSIVERLDVLKQLLESRNYLVQTTRVCSTSDEISALNSLQGSSMNSIGTVDLRWLESNMRQFLDNKNLACNVELSKEEINLKTVAPLQEIIKENAAKTFSFTYVFNNPNSSPYYPSANYEQEGFAIGLQSTDLAENAEALTDWFENMKTVWNEVCETMKDETDFLGIDSSIAPLYEGESSLVNIVRRFNSSYTNSFTTDFYTKITKFIKNGNPKPIGLCGIMMPCLEDFELAEEYEKGEFSIERNIYVSLHSGLGIDTYPIGVDEDPERIVEILKLIQALSNKYNKPLSARFVSDGKAKVGEKTNFQNPYLYLPVV